MVEAGIETSTLEKHLARGQQPGTSEKRLYVVDESSLASTYRSRARTCPKSNPTRRLHRDRKFPRGNCGNMALVLESAF